jgi:hypothetical protein
MGSSTASLSVKEMMEDVAAPYATLRGRAIWVEALRGSTHSWASAVGLRAATYLKRTLRPADLLEGFGHPACP